MDNLFVVPIDAGQFADFVRPHLFFKLPNHVTREDLLRPGAWVHHARKMQGRDPTRPARFGLIEVITEDGSLEMWLRVLMVKDGLPLVRPIFIYEDPRRVIEVPDEKLVAQDGSALPPLPDGYKVGHAPSQGFWVKLLATNDLVYRGLRSRLEAHEKAIVHAKMAGTYREPAKQAETA